jgi:hypothetical protein
VCERDGIERRKRVQTVQERGGGAGVHMDKRQGEAWTPRKFIQNTETRDRIEKVAKRNPSVFGSEMP